MLRFFGTLFHADYSFVVVIIFFDSTECIPLNYGNRIKIVHALMCEAFAIMALFHSIWVGA